MSVDTRQVAKGIGPSTATMLVVASMVGTGIFTTTGFLVEALRSPVAVLAAWAASRS